MTKYTTDNVSIQKTEEHIILSVHKNTDGSLDTPDHSIYFDITGAAKLLTFLADSYGVQIYFPSGEDDEEDSVVDIPVLQ